MLASATDTISGNVYDAGGKAISGCYMAITDENYMSLGDAVTDASGHYETVIPAKRGYHVWAGKTDNNLFTHIPQCKSVEVPRNDFVLTPGVNLILRLYDHDGHLLRNKEFLEATGGVVYASGLNGEMLDSYFSAVHDAESNWDWDMALPALVVKPGASCAVHLQLEVPGFGRTLATADNGGKGYVATAQGSSVLLDLNLEAARSSVSALQRSAYRGSASETRSAEQQLRTAQSLVAQGRMAEAVAGLNDCLADCLQRLEETAVSSAQQGIEKYRKGDLALTVVDNGGRAVSNARVNYQQISHDFQFGANPLGANGVYDASVAGLMRDAGFNQTYATVRWGLIETAPGKFDWWNIDQQQQIDELIAQGFGIVGALCLWTTANSDFAPQYVQGLSFDELLSAVDGFASTIAERYAGRIDVWEINEFNLSAANSLNLSQEQRMRLANTFQRAVKRGNPRALILNNSTALSWESSDSADFLGMLRNGAPADIVGLECYYSGMCSTGYNPPQVTLHGLSQLVDSYSSLGKPIYITELCAPSEQVSATWWQSQWDEATQARYVEYFYTMMFGKRYVNAITWGWGVLDSDAWTVSGGLLTDAKAPKAAYWSIKTLIDSWTTRGSSATDSRGRCTIRGYAGDYQVVITANGKTQTQTVHIDEQSTRTLKITLPK